MALGGRGKYVDTRFRGYDGSKWQSERVLSRARGFDGSLGDGLQLERGHHARKLISLLFQ